MGVGGGARDPGGEEGTLPVRGPESTNHVPMMTPSGEGRGFRKEVRSPRLPGRPPRPQEPESHGQEPRPQAHAAHPPRFTWSADAPGLEDGLFLHLDSLPTQLPASKEMMTKAEGEGCRGADRPTEFRVQAMTFAGLWNKARVHTVIMQMGNPRGPTVPYKELCSVL